MPQRLTTSQAAIDAVVTEWPDVRAKQVFGHRGYVRRGRMFGFAAGEGVAVKAGGRADELYSRDGVAAFAYRETEMRAWPVLPLRDDTDAEAVLTALQEAYDLVAG